MTTIYGYTDTASNCANGGSNYYAALGTNNQGQITAAELNTSAVDIGEGAPQEPNGFERQLLHTTTGTGQTSYYIYEPTYATHNGTNTNSIFFGDDTVDLVDGESVSFSEDTMLINEECFLFFDTNGNSAAINNTTNQYIYLKLFDVSGQKRVLLKYDSDIQIPNQVGPNYHRFKMLGSSLDPVCLTDTCDILTPNGYVNVKDLSVGDYILSHNGARVKITKIMKPTTHVAMGKALPHFIPKNSLGENKPSKDTFISKNHAYKSGDEWLCGQINIEHNATNWDKDFVTYYNVMTEDYPKHSLVVNGIEMEAWGGYEHNKPETHGNIKLRREKLGFK